MTKWRAHTIALVLWAIPPIVTGWIADSRSGLIDFGPIFTLIVVAILWLLVAVPTTIAVALWRSGREGSVVIIHAIAVFVAILTYWFMQG